MGCDTLQTPHECRAVKKGGLSAFMIFSVHCSAHAAILTRIHECGYQPALFFRTTGRSHTQSSQQTPNPTALPAQDDLKAGPPMRGTTCVDPTPVCRRNNLTALPVSLLHLLLCRVGTGLRLSCRWRKTRIVRFAEYHRGYYIDSSEPRRRWNSGVSPT